MMFKKAIKIASYIFLFLIASFIALFYGVAVPVLGLTYHDIYINFENNTVSSFADVPVVLNGNTYNNIAYGYHEYYFSIKFNSCPSANKTITFTTGIADVDNGYSSLLNTFTNLSIPCVTNTYYTRQLSVPFTITDPVKQQRIKDILTSANDTSEIYIETAFYDNLEHLTFNGVVATIGFLSTETRIFYEFNTTYYFDHIALDNQIFYFTGSNVVVPTDTGNTKTSILIAYDSSDYWRIYNSDLTASINRGRKKYNIPIGEKITAYGIGAGVSSEVSTAFSYTIANGINNRISFYSFMWLLNYSNDQQTFPGTGMPNLEYQSCGAWDIPCHLGNSLVYIAKDLPITSDVYGILSKGYQAISNGLYAVTGIFGANFNSLGLVSGNLFSITLVISLGAMLVTSLLGGGGDDDDE